MAGEFWIVAGLAGMGKSALLQTAAGILSPAAGEVLLFGRPLAALPEAELRRVRLRVSLLFEGGGRLFTQMSVAENVALPLELVGRRDGGEVARLLDRVGLAGRGDEDPDRLSGGEQQRVALARALIHAPSVILADEPTGNLDAETGAQVMDLLKGLVRGQGATLVLVTHSAEVAAVADRVWRLTDGHIRDDQDEAP